VTSTRLRIKRRAYRPRCFFVISSNVRREFDLNTYTTKEKLLKAFDDVKQEAGDTNTHLAIDELVLSGFSEANGARKGYPRVTILLTGSQSNDPSKTIVAAGRAHDADITMIAFGVGNDQLHPKELESIASDPICQHLILLNNFTEMDSLKYVMRHRIGEGICAFRLLLVTLAHLRHHFLVALRLANLCYTNVINNNNNIIPQRSKLC